MAYQVILTTIGEAKLAAGIVNLTHMAIGNGGGSEYQPTGSETELVNEVYRKPLSSYNVTGNKVVMQLSIPLADGGFHVREAGIFDEDGDMIYIANIATRYKPLPTEGSASDLSITLVSSVSNLANLSVTVDGTAYVTHSILAVELSDKLDKTDDKATSTEAVAATNNDKFITPETVYLGYGSADPIVLTSGSTHTHAINESIITGAIAPMTIELADTEDYPKSKRNRIALTIANLSNSSWTINGKASGSTNVALSIAGATNNPPVYALDATSLPTIANGAITSNVFTASANAASAQTFDYVSSGDISSITPKMTFTPGTVLTVDPASTTGSTKCNYSASNTVQVGSKLLIDLAGTISEVTVAAGSQTPTVAWETKTTNDFTVMFGDGLGHVVGLVRNSTSSIGYSSDFGATWNFSSLPIPGTQAIFGMAHHNGVWIICTGANYLNQVQTSLDNGVTWTKTLEIGGGSPISHPFHNGTNFCWINNGKMYTSSDGVNWGSHSISGLNGNSFSVTYGNGMYLAISQYSNDNKLFKSSDGNTFTQISNASLPISPSWSSNQFPLYSYLAAYNGNIWCISPTYQGNSQNSVILSNDNLNSFYSSSAILPAATSRICVANVGTKILVANMALNSGAGIITSSDNATTWDTASSGFPAWTSSFITGISGGEEFWAFTFPNPTNLGSIRYTGNNGGYQFTMTSPSIAKPNWAALGGQTEQYSVSITSTPAFTAAATPTYTRSGNTITATYAQVTGLSGTHVQLKAATLNNGDVLSQIGATLLTVGRQTINGKTNITLSAGKVAMMVPTPNGWLST